MKQKIIILALGCFLANNARAMLEEISLSDSTDKNPKKDLIKLAEKQQPETSNCSRENRCCAFLDRIFGLVDNSKPQSKLIITLKKASIPNDD
jgi:hypothetical protein